MQGDDEPIVMYNLLKILGKAFYESQAEWVNIMLYKKK